MTDLVLVDVDNVVGHWRDLRGAPLAGWEGVGTPLPLPSLRDRPVTREARVVLAFNARTAKDLTWDILDELARRLAAAVGASCLSTEVALVPVRPQAADSALVRLAVEAPEGAGETIGRVFCVGKDAGLKQALRTALGRESCPLPPLLPWVNELVGAPHWRKGVPGGGIDAERGALGCALPESLRDTASLLERDLPAWSAFAPTWGPGTLSGVARLTRRELAAVRLADAAPVRVADRVELPRCPATATHSGPRLAAVGRGIRFERTRCTIDTTLPPALLADLALDDTYVRADGRLDDDRVLHELRGTRSRQLFHVTFSGTNGADGETLVVASVDHPPLRLPDAWWLLDERRPRRMRSVERVQGPWIGAGWTVLAHLVVAPEGRAVWLGAAEPHGAVTPHRDASPHDIVRCTDEAGTEHALLASRRLRAGQPVAATPLHRSDPRHSLALLPLLMSDRPAPHVSHAGWSR